MPDDDKQIYRYTLPDGTPRAADPLYVRRRLSRLLGGDGAAVVRDFNGDDDGMAEEAYRRLSAAVCEAFGLGRPFDPATGEGVTEAAWVGVWNDFQAWLVKKNTNTADSPTASTSSPDSARVIS
jgi:hypothetical protein